MSDMRIITFKIPKGLLEKIDRQVLKEGLSSRSELIRRALILYLSRNEEVENNKKRKFRVKRIVLS